MKTYNTTQRLTFALAAACSSFTQMVFAVNLTISQSPLTVSQSATPLVMLNVSKDHQLYFKAFDDFSDLDGDGVPETTYKHSFDYYGYFDSYKCYTYNTSAGQFQPNNISTDKYCTAGSNLWSGNFLNWASMTRIDTIRKILYGGKRSTDSSTATVLERSYLPNDAHSFAKFYNGTDLTSLTPYTSSQVTNGITICNTTVSSTQLSENVTNAPLLRVAMGDYSLWAANERWQCRWLGEVANTSPQGNSNVTATSGLNAASNNPSSTSFGSSVATQFNARVQACASSSLVNLESCKNYNGTLKPIGLLQTYGDNDKIHFGLMTGSYGKNKSGGVLRKNLGTMTDEINVSSDGTFKSAPTAGGIVNTLDKLRTYGYRHDNGTYFGVTGSDNCTWGWNSFNNGDCSNWGNPQAEILLESLRYLAGKSASSAFNVDDSSRISGLTTATPSDPIPSDQWCAALNTIQFNASTTSYDGDELSGVTDIGATGMDTLTNTVGAGEITSGNSYFIGENGTDNNQLCTAKTITNLSDVRGTCPDAPRLSGSYHISGLGYYAHTNSIRSDRTGPQQTAKQLVTTYGVALSPRVPKVVVTVPGTSNQISILPACRNSSVGGNCTIVDFKIVSQTATSTHATGQFYVNWEDSEQGGDFDQDEWGVLNYDITSTQAIITTDVIAQSTPYAMGFGYVISGTNKDGFHAHSGINNFNYTDPTAVTGCNNCANTDAATSVTYSIGASSASSLQQPLFYAAKWGGFNDTDNNKKPNLTSEWDVITNTTGAQVSDGIPDRYFAATNPSQLATSLGNALADVIKTSGSSAAVATNSTRLDTNTVIYQAKFNSADWTGQLLAYLINADGSIASTASWDAGQRVTAQGMSNRSLFSYNPTGITGSGTSLTTKGISFLWANLNAAQQALLTQNQVNYLRGDQTNEQPSGTLRKRTGTDALMGDVINSDPWFISSSRNFGYDILPSTEGSSYLTFRSSTQFQARTPMVAIGGNDGMLHVFNANISGTGNGNEIFAYVPNSVMSNLSSFTSPTYLNSGQHKYFVDGSPIAGDAYFDADGNSVKEWRTVLVETLGAGGKGIFALDVTFLDPASATYATAETSFGANRVLWEINDQSAPVATDLTDDLTGSNKRYGFTNHLGSTLGQASIVRMANGSFAAVFGNGYNSVNQKAVLYIVDIKTGALIKSISTETGDTSNPNGLSTPITVDVNGDRIVDVIYAGDLKGNLWKFDVSSSTASQWDVAFKSGSTSTPLFVATDNSGTVQPITAKPQVGFHPPSSGTFGVLVYVGTGKYFETGDNVVPASPQIETFYGIKDLCVKRAGTSDTCSSTSPNATRSQLVQQSILAQGTGGNFSVRVTSYNDTTVNGDPSKKGWYMDLLTPPSTAASERVVVQALLRSGRIIFVTMTPDSAKCSFGGSSWLMELDALTGNRLNSSPFDLTGNGLINIEDMVKLIDTNNDHTVNASDALTSASGKQSTVGIIKSPGVIGAGTVEYKYTSGSSGSLESTTESATGGGGRISWRQLR